MKFAIVERGDAYSKELADYIKERCQQEGWQYHKSNPDLIISIGGDGTMLRSIHEYLDQLDSVCFVGIHTGTLGFLTDYTKQEIHLFLHGLFNKKPQLEEFPLLEITLPEKKETFYAFNEIRIESIAKTVHLNIYIDGEFFEKTTGSGICISTQNGSTAINRALSGAVVDSGLQVMQLSEIMPIVHNHHHSLKNPYIMRKDREIMVQGDTIRYTMGCYDHLSRTFQDVNQILIRTSQKKVRFARYRTYSYLRRLKELY
ncbi:NAD kinase [Firmicutes bacterium AM41-11]|nr:NAD kinase [Firmicutes bacterium AM41-11]